MKNKYIFNIYIKGEWDNYYEWTRQKSKTTLSRATVYQKHSLLHTRNSKYSKWYLPSVSLYKTNIWKYINKRLINGGLIMRIRR